MKRLAVVCTFITFLLAAGVGPRGGIPGVQAGTAPASSWHVLSRPGMPSFLNPAGLAIDSTGNIYVADFGHDQIQKISPSGRRLALFGSQGWRPGHLRNPTAVGLDRWGNVYVLDASRVQKFSPRGKVLAKFALSDPQRWESMAVDATGTIYLSNYGQILKISPGSATRTMLISHGGPMALDPSGNLYQLSYWEYDPATRTGARSIYELSPGGAILRRLILDSRIAPNAQSIAVDGSANVYLLDPYGNTVLEVTSRGTVARTWRIPGVSGYGSFTRGVAVDRRGNLFVTDFIQQRLWKLSPAGVVTSWGAHGVISQRYRLPESLGVDRAGDIYVADTWNNRVRKLSPTGTVLATWGRPGNGRGQLTKPTSVVVDRQGQVIVVDYANSRLEFFTPSGGFIRTLRLPGTHYAYNYIEPYWPSYYYGSYSPQPNVGLALDPQGNFIIADTANDSVYRLSPWGKVLATFSQWVTDRESLPISVAVDTVGNIYITDLGKARIVKLTPSGTKLAVWGRFGYVGMGALNRPAGIALDAAGNVYVTDAGNHRIQKFDPTGRAIAAWGILGSDHGQFASPRGIAIGTHGEVYVADTWNNRIQKLAP